MTRTIATATCALAMTGMLAGCMGRTAEDRAREAAADIEASITDYDGPALNQEVDPAVVKEVETNLTAIDQYMGAIDGEIDQVLVNAIQAFQRDQNAKFAWWEFWNHSPNDGLITDELRAELAAAAAATS